MDLARALDSLRPGAEYRGSLTVATQARYDALEWLDARAKPTWEEVAAVASDAPVPLTVTRFQARAALLAAGLLDDVEAMVAASPDPLLKLAWADALEFQRHSPTVLALSGQLGLSSAATDELFRLAATITA